MLKVGIPNTLFAAYHLSYWHQFLSQLGMEVIISDESNKELIDLGSKVIPPEFCIPIKMFMGHMINLKKKNVDLFLVPRMISHGNRNFFCPKLIGLPEIVKFSLSIDEERLFSPEIICNGLHLKMMKYPLQKIKPLKIMKRVENQANIYWETLLAKCRWEKLTLPEAYSGQRTAPHQPLTKIGLLGYAYSLYDPFISKGLVKKMAELGAEIYTWEMLNPDLIQWNLRQLRRPLFWNFGRIILGAGLHFLENPKIEGVIYATTFGCGPDSVAMKLLSLESSRFQKPFLQLTLDEHTEDGHLKTRLEAFIDMLKEKKEDQAI